MGDKEDYLTSYRVFFENFAATVNPEDQLPVNIAGYTITESELPGEVLYWTTQYLSEKQCPLSLLTPLLRIILDEVRVASKKQPTEFGYKADESVYIALRLMQAVTARVNGVCLRYLDNSRLDSLPPPPAPHLQELRTVSAATKNSRRVMEDRHVEIGNLEALFGIECTKPTAFYAVYDGHAGSAAAMYCAAHLHQYLVESPHFATDLRKALRDAFLRTDNEFIRKSDQERACGGSTAVAVVVRGRTLHAAWAGDSLALLAKRMRLMQLVRPHKPSRQVQVVVRGRTLHAAWAGDSLALLAKRMRLMQLVRPHKPSRQVQVVVRGRTLHAAWAGDSLALLAKRMRLMQLVRPHKPSRQVQVVVRGRTLHAAWAGDSLALLAKRMRLMQLVRPHKPSRQVQVVVRGRTLHAAWAGDSLALLAKRMRLMQLVRPHKPSRQVQVVVRGRTLHAAWAGDSLALLAKRMRLMQLVRPHKPSRQVQVVVRGRTLHAAWAGDSLALLAKRMRLMQLVRPHKPSRQVQVVVRGRTLHAAWAGDSLALLAKRMRLMQLVRPHKPSRQVQVVVRGRTLHAAWAGDSLALLAKRMRLMQLVRPHKPSRQVQVVVRGRTLHAAWAGDSLALLAKRMRLMQLVRPHKPSRQVQVVVRGRTLHAAWAGDSLALLAKRMRLMQLVRPHKPSRQDEKDRIQAGGGAVMFWGTWRVNGQLAVSRAIGDAMYKPYVTARPELATVDLDGDEDFVVVACDGLWDFVSEDDVALAVYRQLAADPDDLKAVTKRLIVQAKRQGSGDNISIIVVFLKDPRNIAADNRPPMDLGLDNALVNASLPPFAEAADARKHPMDAAGAECAAAEPEGEGELAGNGVDNSDSDSEDLGPETAVDADDLDAEARNHVSAPTPPAHTVEASHIDGALADNVGESGEESEDEWNYFKGEGERSEQQRSDPDDQDEPPRSETPCQDNSAWESSSVDMNSSPLNPDAPVFVPGTAPGADILLAESPRKPQPMDDIELPDVAQFETEVVRRPAELLDLDNCDQLNGHHNVSFDGVTEQLNGNEKNTMDSLGFGFSVGVESDKAKDISLIQDFDRIQKDTTDFCNIQVFQAHSETNPFASDDNEELLERLKSKERDPMSMSFYQEKDDDTCERLHGAVDLNAVQPLPDSDSDSDDDNDDKENHSPPPDNDAVRPAEPSDHDLFAQGANFIDYVNNTNNQNFPDIQLQTEQQPDSVMQTDTPESHKLLFEQIPEIPDGKSSELGFNEDNRDPSDRAITPQEEVSQDVEMEFKSEKEVEADSRPESAAREPPQIQNGTEFAPIEEVSQQQAEHTENHLTSETSHTEKHEHSNEVALSPAPADRGDVTPEPAHEQENIKAEIHNYDRVDEHFDNVTDAHEIEPRDVETPHDLHEELDLLSAGPQESGTASPLPSETALSPAPHAEELQADLLAASPAPHAEDLLAASPVPHAEAHVDLLATSPAPYTADLLAASPVPHTEGLHTGPLAASPAPHTEELHADLMAASPTPSPLPVASPIPTEPEHISRPLPAESPAPVSAPSPLPAEVPLPAERALPAESPLPAASPLPVESALPVETSIPRESPLPVEIERPIRSPAPEAAESPLPVEPVLRPETASPFAAAPACDRLTPDVPHEEPVAAPIERTRTPETASGPAPDIVPEPSHRDLVTDIDIGIPESHAQEICVPVTSEIVEEAVQLTAGTPPPTPAVDLAAPTFNDKPAAADDATVAAAAAVGAAATTAIAATAATAAAKAKTPAKKAAASPAPKTTATPKSATKPAAASAGKKPAAAPAARPAARPSLAKSPAKPKPATTPTAAKPAPRPAVKSSVAPAKEPPAAKAPAPSRAAPAARAAPKAPSARPAAPAAKPAAARAAPAARPATAPAARAAPKPAATTRPAPRPTPRPTPAAAKPKEVKPAERKPLTNGEAKAPAPIRRAPLAAKPAPRAAPRPATAPATAPTTKPAARAPLDKQSKDLANKRITAKAAPPRTAQTKTAPPNKNTAIKSVPKKPVSQPTNGLVNGGDALKPPPSPPADNALLPDVIA